MINKYVPAKLRIPGNPCLSAQRLKKSRKLKRQTTIKYRKSRLHAHKMKMINAEINHQTKLSNAKYRYEETIAANPRRFHNYAKYNQVLTVSW